MRGVRFDNAAAARPAPALRDWLAGSPQPVVVICPSNPWLSVDPVLAVPGLRERLAALPVVAVSPIVGGRALKGPAAKMMAELGLPVSALEVARHYRGLADAFVIDREDEAQGDTIRALGMRVLVTDTVMSDAASKRRLAADVLALMDTFGA